MWNDLFFIGCYWRTDIYKVRPNDFIALAEARHVARAFKEAAWLFQSHVGVAVGTDMMQKPEIGDEDRCI